MVSTRRVKTRRDFLVFPKIPRYCDKKQSYSVYIILTCHNSNNALRLGDCTWTFGQCILHTSKIAICLVDFGNPELGLLSVILLGIPCLSVITIALIYARILFVAWTSVRKIAAQQPSSGSTEHQNIPRFSRSEMKATCTTLLVTVGLSQGYHSLLLRCGRFPLEKISTHLENSLYSFCQRATLGGMYSYIQWLILSLDVQPVELLLPSLVIQYLMKNRSFEYFVS